MEYLLFAKTPPPSPRIRVETRASMLANVLGSLVAGVAFVRGIGRKVRTPTPD